MTKFKHFVGERDRQKQIAGWENILRERPAADYGRLNDGKRERGWKRKEKKRSDLATTSQVIRLSLQVTDLSVISLR